MTSDDLMNILEDDYQNESEFKIPNMDLTGGDLDDQQKPTNIDEYLNSIVSSIYSEYETFEAPIECIVSSAEDFQ